jgi:hypothetical protein
MLAGVFHSRVTTLRVSALCLRLALFFFYAMVGHIMARLHRNAIRTNATAPAVASRALLAPGTLVFLG